MKINFSYWIKLSLFNLLLVATLGLLMRYKIAFELPFVNQKNLQHSHSHFAFAGWVTQTLFVLMVRFLNQNNENIRVGKYKIIFLANLICAYVMLFSFILQGYGLISIMFSTLSLFVSFWFAYVYIKDLKLMPSNLATNWFKLALFFNVLSSFGTFALAYMMATKNVPQDLYLSSIYFYLHFQYNGWFWFACMGLFVGLLKPNLAFENLNLKIFRWFSISAIPTYLLSVLWLKIPTWLYIIAILSAILQIIAWIKFIKEIIPKFRRELHLSKFLSILFSLITVCISIKFVLQLGTTIPSLGKLAFGFRPIIIAYLHLVLLAIISGFLLAYIYVNSLIVTNVKTFLFLILFMFGIFINELLLAIQGFAAFSYTLIPNINLLLLFAAVILFVGMLGVVLFNTKKDNLL
jgi:hypothetical protein